MCGIAGIFNFDPSKTVASAALDAAANSLNKRGPDNQATFNYGPVGLAHARLSIIDTSAAAHQPMQDPSGRYTLVYNGEVYNFQELRKKLEDKGVSFQTHSDTEVLLHSYIQNGPDFLQDLNGFFALAIHDKEEGTLLLARDRMGIKPLLVYQDDDKIIFGSEMKALYQLGLPRELDPVSIYQYLQLNYIAGPATIYRNLKKMEPGNYALISANGVVENAFYRIPVFEPGNPSTKLSYDQQQKKLIELLDESVAKRLISDVPLGAFLSGGIDSSVIVALASRHTDLLNTFSIGYKDEPFFDETKYAKLVADKYKTNHTVFSLSNDDLYEHLFEILDYIDEPFADSSAIAVNILSRQTRQKVTVALSGDGADEMFSGYNKHYAEYRVRQKDLANRLVSLGFPIWEALPKSRNSKLGNLARQLHRFAEGSRLGDKERYWRWCAFVDENDAASLLHPSIRSEAINGDYLDRKSEVLQFINQGGDFNEILYTDLHLVLRNDMLTKVDLMSMANSLEIRVPFLDHNVVNFAASLPSESKINASQRKRILKDAFRKMLPEELYTRPKHGFEVPLLKWFRNDLKSMITDDLLDETMIEEQGIFDPAKIRELKNQLFSTNPGEVHARIWGLIVFQWWWRKYHMS